MSDKTIYLKLSKNVKTSKELIRIGELGKVYCEEKSVSSKIKTLPVYRMQKKDHKRCVVGVLKVVELIHNCYPEYAVDVVGETECVVELVSDKETPKWIAYGKIAIVSAICFFGTMYTIMAYHNEINLVDMFDQFHLLITGEESDGFTPLEASYSLGLSLGIILFYNHIGRRRLTPDPSPVEVEMRTYEDDVNRSLVELASREGDILDAK